MASIFDSDPNDLPPRPVEPEPARRSKNREIEAMTSYEAVQGKRRLYDMVEKAFKTLEECIEKADYATAMKAATAILDRAGFGPKSTMDINTVHMDLSNLSREELSARAERVHRMLKEQAAKQLPQTIDAEVVKSERIM